MLRFYTFYAPHESQGLCRTATLCAWVDVQQSYKNPSSTDEFPHRATPKSPSFCCPPAKDMTQLVTPLNSLELAPKLEELSKLASQIACRSDELRSMLQRDPFGKSASACALLHVALSNAQGCLSLLQSVNKAPIHPPPLPPSKSPVHGPSSPLFSSPTPTRHSVTIAELVDEEDSSPGTRGGVGASRPLTTHVRICPVGSYPPLRIAVVDVSPPVPRVTNHGQSTPSVDEKVPRRSNRKVAPVAAPEVPGKDVKNRGRRAKRNATKDHGVDPRPSKRAKIGFP